MFLSSGSRGPLARVGAFPSHVGHAPRASTPTSSGAGKTQFSTSRLSGGALLGPQLGRSSSSLSLSTLAGRMANVMPQSVRLEWETGTDDQKGPSVRVEIGPIDFILCPVLLKRVETFFSHPTKVPTHLELVNLHEINAHVYLAKVCVALYLF